MADTLESKITAITNAYLEDIRERHEEYFIDMGISVDEMTPIEQLMAWGIHYALKSPQYYDAEGGENEFVADPVFVWTAPYGIHVHPQVKVGKYVADFLVDLRHDRGGHVIGIIECDGHDYHERTKGQAQHDKERDRFFQSEGFIVLRYTGSEIWRDPIKCAVDGLKILYARAAEQTKKMGGK